MGKRKWMDREGGMKGGVGRVQEGRKERGEGRKSRRRRGEEEEEEESRGEQTSNDKKG